LANTFYRDERRQHARSFALLALEVSDVIPEVHVLLGELALESGDKSQAKARFERALAVRPDFYPAKRGLALVREP
jgi:Tfp pilus assembly protein PilF